MLSLKIKKPKAKSHVLRYVGDLSGDLQSEKAIRSLN